MVNLFVRSMGASGIRDAITTRAVLPELIETPEMTVLPVEVVEWPEIAEEAPEVVMARSVCGGARRRQAI
jgi:hypothetical protein